MKIKISKLKEILFNKSIKLIFNDYVYIMQLIKKKISYFIFYKKQFLFFKKYIIYFNKIFNLFYNSNLFCKININLVKLLNKI